ncbi:NAD(P)-dependent oxidoreductase [Xinfangfangia sp. D13-10-4-6]|uniref:NAD-dependent epimerase/dehydratase family protein n=1 Tax=Pseudogemmobacter hezensis TaxID=2737662 RepID=UPI00155382A0|nr:NAD(P)-dependent oxidoreductase [Pseudogemmobacter hezensis]NPD15395.1 NAD(P)-dependent oxidoreductase [Pseudogemmobacter hezensis]
MAAPHKLLSSHLPLPPGPAPLPPVVVPVVVTGASGRVANVLRRALGLAGLGEDETGLSFLWSSRGGALPDIAGKTTGGAARHIRWDIGAEPAPEWPRGAILLHLAGTTGAKEPGRNPALIAAVIAACAQNAVRHVVHISTAAIYAPGPGAARETDAPCPANPYGAAKYQTEGLLRDGDRGIAQGLTILRLGNLIGADALLGKGVVAPIRLDPVPGETGEDGPAPLARGPLRSWIGPITFAQSLVALLQRIAAGQNLPDVINFAQSPPLGMAELLRLSGIAWEWAPPNPAVTASAVLDTTRLQGLLQMPAANAKQLIAERNALFQTGGT